MKKIDYKKLIICLLIPQLAGLLGSIANITSLDSWYLSLNKPSFNPPNWIFGPVWTFLFLLMGISLYLIWQKRNLFNQRQWLFSLKIFSIQLGLNILWSYLFFFFHSPLAGLAGIVLLWVFILFNIIYFYKLNKTAGLLLIPYLLWVSFASVLNFNLWILNS